MGWGAFTRAFKHIINNGNVLSSPEFEEVRSACHLSPAAQIVRLRYSFRGIYTLKELLDLCADCRSECKDIRDRIYGLVGLSRDVGIAPDYTKTPSQLYIDVMLAWLSNSTKNEELHLLSFLGTLQGLLQDPLWNRDRETFYSVHRIGRSDQLLNWQNLSLSCSLRKLERIAHIGFIITPKERKHAMDYIVKYWKIEDNGLELRNRIVDLSTRDFHRTTRLNVLHLRRRIDYFSLSLNNKEQDALSRTRTSGRCCTFITSDGGVGIASHSIEVNDLLCIVLGINDLFLVIRLAEDGESLILVGRALLLLPGKAGTHISNLNFPNTIGIEGSRLFQDLI